MRNTLSPTIAAQKLEQFVAQHPRLVVLTGAGISTASGIPDYRDHQTKWKRKPPVQHHDFMSQLYTRQRFWARSLIGWPIMRDAQPNTGHQRLVAWEQQGYIDLVITQNVDGLHQQAGQRHVIDLHGRSDRVICTQCHHIMTRDDTHNEMAIRNPDFCHFRAQVAPDGDADLEGINFHQFVVLDCPRCGGILKPDVIFFGDNVPRETVLLALNTLETADALLVIGSSLMVYSGYRFCKRAHEWNIPIAALNLGQTRADSILNLKLDASISETLAATSL